MSGRYRIGLVVPSSNVTVEAEVPALLGRHPAAPLLTATKESR